MRKIKILLAVLIILVAGKMNAQQLTATAVNTAGQTHSVGGIFLEDAMGGLLVNTVSTATFMYTQDFLQPDAGTTSFIPPINDVALNSGSGLDNAGTTFISDEAMIEFTLGEVSCLTLNGSSKMLTQGILQPYRLYMWTGLVNNDWPNTGNWELGIIPTQTDEALIPDSCPHYPIIINGVFAKCKKLTVKPTASVIVDTGGILKIFQ